MLELHRVADKEHRRIVPHHVVIAFTGVELQRKAARIAPGIRTAPLAGHGGKADQRIRPGARLEHRRLGIGTDILRDLEMAEGAGALGVRLPLRNPLAIEIRHLLDQVVILQNDGAIRPHGEGVFVTGYRDTGIVGRAVLVVFFHCAGSSALSLDTSASRGNKTEVTIVQDCQC